MSDYNPQDRHKEAGIPWHESLLTFAKYGVVGGAQNAFFYGLTLGLLWLKFRAWQAQAILYPVAMTISFLANRSWSFGNRTKSDRQFRNYVMVYVIAYPLSIFFTWSQERLGVPSWLASLITMAVAACAIFFALNCWVFGKIATREISP